MRYSVYLLIGARLSDGASRPTPFIADGHDAVAVPALAATPLSGLERHTLGLLIASVTGQEPDLPLTLTVGEALDVLSSLGRNLFGGS